MQIPLETLDYTFQDKPLLIGGKAMEYYNLRKAGADIDFVISARDHTALVAKYPNNVQDLFGDIGVSVSEFELWNRILLFEYNFLAEHSIELETLRVIALDKLLFLKALAMDDPKYKHDVDLIVEKIKAIQYGKDAQFLEKYFIGRTNL